MVVAGWEQIKLTDYAIEYEFGDDFSGKILPSATVIGGIWFGFKRAKLADIQKMTIYIDGPSDENLNTLGAAFNFVLDLSNRQFAPEPDELK